MKKPIEEWAALDYLYDCRDKLRAYVELSDKRDMIKASLLPRAIRYTHDRIQTTPEDYFTHAMALIADIDGDLAALRAQYRRARVDAEQIIDNVRGAARRVILTDYFVEPDVSPSGRMSVQKLENIAKKHGWHRYYVEDTFAEIKTLLQNSDF